MSDNYISKPSSITHTVIGRVKQKDSQSRPSPDGDQAANGTLSPAGVLHSLRRWWKFSLPVGLVLGCLAAPVGWFLTPSKYQASAYLQIESTTPTLVFETADPSAKRSFDLYRSTQAQLIRTPFVLLAALEDEEISSLPEIASQDQPVDWLKNELKVGFPEKGEIMEVSIETTSSKASIKIVNAVVDAYIREVVNRESEARLIRFNKLKQRYHETEEKVRGKKSELKDMASTLGAGDSESLTTAQRAAMTQYTLMQENLSQVQWELMQVEGELQVVNEIIKRVTEADSNNVPGVAAEPGEESDRDSLSYAVVPPPSEPPKTAEVIGLESKVAQLQGKIASSSAEYGNRHPVTRELKAQLATAEQLLQTRKADAEKLLERLIEEYEVERHNREISRTKGVAGVPEGRKLPADPIELAARISVLQRQEQKLDDKVAELERKTKIFGTTSIDAEMLRLEIESMETAQRFIGEEVNRTSIELDSEDRIESLSKAEFASPPDPKKRIAIAGMLGLIGLCGPFAFGLGRDFLRKPVDDPDVVSTTLSLATIGTLPKVRQTPPGTEPRRLSRKDEREQFELAEAVRSVSGLIMQHVRQSDEQVFMLTSPSAGEGKSTTACHLARSLARGGKRVVLVDTDFRRPSIHRHMGVNATPGLSEVLRSKSRLRHAVQRVADEPNLSVIVAGEMAANLQGRCADNTMDAFFSMLRAKFDVVIVDACPVLPIVDARLLSTYCDGVFLTLLRDTSRLPAAKKACDMLRDYGATIFGTIVIGVASKFYSDKYRYLGEPEPEPALVEVSL